MGMEVDECHWGYYSRAMNKHFLDSIPGHTRFVVGIDEAGRGPLAGPVSVGAVMVPAHFDLSFFEDIRDSKKLSEKAREAWFLKIKNELQVRYAVSMISSSVIDKKGIVYAVSLGIQRVLQKMEADPSVTYVYLDGGIKAPQQFKLQETIIKGDNLIPLISAGAIMAKVTRDRYMTTQARKFPEYGFEIHKGYGTVRHRTAIANSGLCTEHRRSFLTRTSFSGI